MLLECSFELGVWDGRGKTNSRGHFFPSVISISFFRDSGRVGGVGRDCCYRRTNSTVSFRIELMSHQSGWVQDSSTADCLKAPKQNFVMMIIILLPVDKFSTLSHWPIVWKKSGRDSLFFLIFWIVIVLIFIWIEFDRNAKRKCVFRIWKMTINNIQIDIPPRIIGSDTSFRLGIRVTVTNVIYLKSSKRKRKVFYFYLLVKREKLMGLLNRLNIYSHSQLAVFDADGV